MFEAFVVPAKFPTAGFGIALPDADTTRRPPAEMHQGSIHCHTMQPGGQRGFTAKRCQLAKRLNESFLGEIVSVRRVICHAKAHGMHPALVCLKERCKRVCVAI